MRRSDKLKNIERANLLAEQRHLESKGVLTEGIIDKVKDILIGPINDLIDKLDDKGQEVYNKLVDSFGENPSMDTIKAKVQSELNEDRDFGKLGLMDDPKYADKEGKQNTTDKIMGVLSQIMGLNLSALGGVPLAAAITVMLGLPVFGGYAIGAVLSVIISFIIRGLADRYGHARAKQLDEATNLLAEQRHLESKGLVTETSHSTPPNVAQEKDRPRVAPYKAGPPNVAQEKDRPQPVDEAALTEGALDPNVLINMIDIAGEWVKGGGMVSVGGESIPKNLATMIMGTMPTAAATAFIAQFWGEIKNKLGFGDE
jgi:hypothetical protein